MITDRYRQAFPLHAMAREFVAGEHGDNAFWMHKISQAMQSGSDIALLDDENNSVLDLLAEISDDRNVQFAGFAASLFITRGGNPLRLASSRIHGPISALDAILRCITPGVANGHEELLSGVLRGLRDRAADGLCFPVGKGGRTIGHALLDHPGAMMGHLRDGSLPHEWLRTPDDRGVTPLENLWQGLKENRHRALGFRFDALRTIRVGAAYRLTVHLLERGWQDALDQATTTGAPLGKLIAQGMQAQAEHANKDPSAQASLAREIERWHIHNATPHATPTPARPRL